MRTTVVVVGGGVIGSTIAWYAARDGFDVTVLDPDPTRGASWVAGGMLAPITEAWPGEDRLLELGSAALERWPAFASTLNRDAGVDCGWRESGTVAVAVDTADAEELDMLARYLAERGRDARRCTVRELRRIEPALGPSIRAGLWVPGDLAVDNRALLSALRTAGPVVLDREVSRVDTGVVELTDGSVRTADLVVVAAGVHSSGLHPALAGAVRPVKGEILRLRRRPTAVPPPTRVIRAANSGRRVYLVPRPDGVIVGATQYEAGFDTEVTVAGVRDLIADAERVVPGIGEYALVEASAGLRPVTAPNLPIVEQLAPGVLAATGHGRNGLLLAPLTAETVLAWLKQGAWSSHEPGRRITEVEEGT